MNYTVLKLDHSHVQSWAALRAEALTTHPFAFGSVAPSDSRPLETLFLNRLGSGEESAIFGAIESSALVGMVGIARNSGAKERHKALVWGMYVRPLNRTSGLGERLLRAAIDHARLWNGVTDVHLSVSSVAVEAKRLYEKLGFRVWGEEPRALCWEGRCVDEMHMILTIGV